MYSRKNEAKSQTASLAIEMGAIDFITTGDTDPLKAKKGLVLAPLDAHSDESPEAPPEPEDPTVQEIEDCCVEWRAGSVKPYWVALNEPKFGSSASHLHVICYVINLSHIEQGCALRIELSPHSLRVYSSDTKYDTVKEAKAACAKFAHDQGVIEFIKHGNGQVEPEKPADVDAQESASKAAFAPPSQLTLQEFYETFPQPFPENFGDKSAAEINAPSWLNTTIQGARGSKLTANFIWTTNGTPWGGNLGCERLISNLRDVRKLIIYAVVHGCLLRLERPEESKSYLVDPRFLKRADAKAAVCLQAISQGVGDYIRGVIHELECKVTPIMRRWANEVIFPTLGSECGKIKPGTHPRYDFPKERDGMTLFSFVFVFFSHQVLAAYGCTMILELSSFPTPEQTKTFSVPADYRTKADAKIALACLAAELGAIEFLRFRGGPSPPDYQSFHSVLVNGKVDVAQPKRKNQDDGRPGDSKRPRTDSQGSVPLLETGGEVLGRLNPSHSLRASHSQPFGNRPESDNGWKKPRGPVSGGFGGISRPPQGPPIGQSRQGSRNMRNFTEGQGSSSAAPRSSFSGFAGPPGPSKSGLVMLGLPGNRPLYPPGHQQGPNLSNAQQHQPNQFNPLLPRQGPGMPHIHLPQDSQFTPHPPPPQGPGASHIPQPFTQTGPHPTHAVPPPPPPRYYPPGMPPYGLPQQYSSARPGYPPAPLHQYSQPFSTGTASVPTYDSFSGGQFQQQSHFSAPLPAMPPSVFQPPQTLHSPYPGVAGPPAIPTANSPPNFSPGYGGPQHMSPGVSGQLPYVSHPNYQSQPPKKESSTHRHQSPLPLQSPHASISAPLNRTAVARPVNIATPSESPSDDMQVSDEDIPLTVTSTSAPKSRVAALLGTCIIGCNPPKYIS